MKDDPKNKQGQGGGPKTDVGKAVSSKNAVTHGITSKEFVSLEETSQFKDLIEEFSQASPSSHPAIRLQVERLVHTRIQLQRVQRLIHAQHLKSRATSVIESQLHKELKFDQDTADMEYYQRINILDQDLVYLGKLLSEIFMVSTKELKEPEAYLKKMPTLFRQLEKEARDHEMDLITYLKGLIRRKQNKSGIEIVVIRPDEAKKVKAQEITQTMREVIQDFSVEDIKDLIAVKQVDLRKSLDMEGKIDEFRKLLPIIKEANLPDLDILDKLMRYQTSLNNQLSKQMGELIDLERRYVKN